MKLVMSKEETLGIVAIFRDFYDVEKRFQENKSNAAAEQRNLQEKIASMLPQAAELLQAYFDVKSPSSVKITPSPSLAEFYSSAPAPETAPYFAPKSLESVDFEVMSAVYGGKNAKISVRETTSGMVFHLYAKSWPESPEMAIWDSTGAPVGTLQWSATAPYLHEIPSLKINLPNHIAFRNPDRIVINGDMCSIEFSSEPKQTIHGISCIFCQDESNTPHYILDAMGTSNWFLSGDLFPVFGERAWLYERGGESCSVAVEVNSDGFEEA